MMNEFDICMCANGPYLQHILEVAFNAHDMHQDAKINMHVITDFDISKAKDLLCSFNIANVDFKVYSSHALDSLLTDLSNDELRFTKMTYSKLLMFDVLPKKKILYIDTDVLFYKPALHDLFSYDISEFGIGAVDDFAVMHFDTAEIQQMKCTSYFNAGFMMIDLASDKMTNMNDAIHHIIKNHNIKFHYADQTILNFAVQSKYARMPVRFNVMLNQFMHPMFLQHFNEYNDANALLNDIRLIHYAGKYCQPWKPTCNMNHNNLFMSFYCHNKLKMIEYIASVNKLNTYQELVNLI